MYRKWLLLLVVCGTMSIVVADDIISELTPRTRKSIEHGLSFLAKAQYPSGEWRSDIGFKLNNDYRVTRSESPHVGVTALACLALMSDGNLPDRGRYGTNVRKGLEFILSCVKDTGYITKHGTRMYSHAFATLFLAEIYGMTGNIEVRKKLEKAVNLIVNSQNPRGGWRYVPDSDDADLSVTVCQVQALRAARNVGIRVGKVHIEQAIRYIQRSFDHTRKGFKYQDLPMRQTRVTFAVTAAGVTSLHGAGVYEDRIVDRGIEYLERPPRNDPHPPPYHYFYFYGHYYAVQAMYMTGGSKWHRWYSKVRDQLVEVQNHDGSWEDNVGKTCATALAVIILQAPNRYLPIFQR